MVLHPLTQVACMVIPLFPYYFAHKTWPDSSFFQYYVGPTFLTIWMVMTSFYNLRMFYRVPHRYSSALWIFYVQMLHLSICLQVILQQHQRNIQSCAQSIASLAKEIGCALSSQWDIPGGHPQEWVEGGFFLSFLFISLSLLASDFLSA